MQSIQFWTYLLVVCLWPTLINGQCAGGEVEVEMEIQVDEYGYEIYWELVPFNNGCGNATIDFGGNPAVGCSGGGSQNQTPGGYDAFQVVNVGPWCLTEGAMYDLVVIDDFADISGTYSIDIAGFPMHEISASGSIFTYTFVASPPPAYEVVMKKIGVPGFVNVGQRTIMGQIKNEGTTTINSMELHYSIDGGAAVTQNLSGLNIEPFNEFAFEHETLWNASAPGTVDLKIWVSNFNGQGDDTDPSNNELSKAVVVKEPIPNVLAFYYNENYSNEIVTIGGPQHQVKDPTDLDFHGNGDLWVVNRGTENTGGSTVKFINPGGLSQSFDYKKDQNSWHFMSLPSGIAFSDNGNFATSSAVFDANHDGGSAFSGPALWSSDPEIYAQPSGGNGSHLDMLHESPYSMGIASQEENRFWVTDAYSNDVVMYDFVDDHGPGNDYHGDGIVLRYPEAVINWVNQDIPCHLIYHEDSGWLYVVDGGGKRVLRLDVNSGVVGGTPSYPQMEELAQYANVTGVTIETVVETGLEKPTGIDILDNTLIVSDNANGNIILFDVSTLPATELGRINTGDSDVMGVVIGPEGEIWYVDGNSDKVAKVNFVEGNGIAKMKTKDALTVFPNPASEIIYLTFDTVLKERPFAIYDVSGRVVMKGILSAEKTTALQVNDLPKGTYILQVGFGDAFNSKRISIH